jgi:thiol-disulfide isomerase/thioredoxin
LRTCAHKNQALLITIFLLYKSGESAICQLVYEKINTMERSGKITLVVLVIVVLLMAAATYYVVEKRTQAKYDNSQAGASLQTKEGQSPYTDIAGNPVALEDYLGQTLVVYSWASWCPFCAQELPNLAQLGREFADDNVHVLAINRAEPSTTAEAFLQSIDAVDGLMLVLDPDDRFYESIAGFTMPETVFYNPEGTVVLHKRGTMTYQELVQNTQKAIE